MQKTNAMRFLDDLDINYDILEYNASDGKIDGISVAEKIGYSLDMVYKTLVLKGENIFVCIVPVQEEIDLKAMAKAIKEKKVEMIHVKDILTLTGYVRGGCSPFAMKKKYPTYIQEDIILQDEIIVSGGKNWNEIKFKILNFF